MSHKKKPEYLLIWNSAQIHFRKHKTNLPYINILVLPSLVKKFWKYLLGACPQQIENPWYRASTTCQGWFHSFVSPSKRQRGNRQSLISFSHSYCCLLHLIISSLMPSTVRHTRLVKQNVHTKFDCVEGFLARNFC